MEECKNRDKRALEWNETKPMTERDKFEKWASKNHPGEWNEDMWIGWQAALSANQPEIDALKIELAETLTKYASTLDGIIALKAENEKLRKDAERYRWLRFADDEQLAKVRSFSINNELPEGDAFDEAIDAAMTTPDTKGE
jgi:hypothetical protein